MLEKLDIHMIKNKVIILNEVSQTEEGKYTMYITYVLNLKNNQMNLFVK